MLAAAGPYMAERVADLDDLRNRTIATLLGVPMPGVPDPGHPFVLVALDLAPADTATLDADRVRASSPSEGGPTSHTAILAKSLGLPAVVWALPPAAATAWSTGPRARGRRPRRGEPSPRRSTPSGGQLAALQAVSGPGRTSDGHPVQLLVNIAGDKDLAPAAAADSEGVGLFRTEFLFLDRPDAPTLEEQQAVYQRVFDAFAGRKVVVRTLDAGADKPLAFVTVRRRAQPGARRARAADLAAAPGAAGGAADAVADAAAASEAEVWVMAPMVSTAAEAAGVRRAGARPACRPRGVMVEVPAAALQGRRLLAAAATSSPSGPTTCPSTPIAADRMAGELADLLDPWQPALLDLVAACGEAGKARGKPVGVCGEAAGDPLLALVLVGLGITSLSMAARAVPLVGATLARLSLGDCAELARLALEADSAASARAAVHERIRG